MADQVCKTFQVYGDSFPVGAKSIRKSPVVAKTEAPDGSRRFDFGIE